MAAVVDSTDGAAVGECGFEGNPDLYGIGVRIAFYLQIMSTVLISTDKFEIPKTLTVNLWFQFALFITLIYTTATGQLNDVEAYTCIYLLDALSILGSVVYRVLGSSSEYSLASRSAHAVVKSAIVGYAVWFWWVGVFALHRPPCESVGFFFTRTQLQGWLRILHLVWYTFRLLLCTKQLLMAGARLLIFTLALLLSREKIPTEVLYPGNGRWEWVAWFLDPDPTKYEGFKALAAYLKKDEGEAKPDQGGKTSRFTAVHYH